MKNVETKGQTNLDVVENIFMHLIQTCFLNPDIICTTFLPTSPFRRGKKM